MKFSIKKGNLEKQRSACMVVGIFEPRKLTEPAKAIDTIANGYISGVLRSGDMEGKAGSTLVLHNIPGAPCERVLLVGLGKEPELNDKGYRNAIGAAFKALNQTGAAEDFSFFLNEVPGLFFNVGVVPRDRDPAKAAPNHSPNFFIDESALVVGVRALAAVTVNYLAGAKTD